MSLKQIAMLYGLSRTPTWTEDENDTFVADVCSTIEHKRYATTSDLFALVASFGRGLVDSRGKISRNDPGDIKRMRRFVNQLAKSSFERDCVAVALLHAMKSRDVRFFTEYVLPQKK